MDIFTFLKQKLTSLRRKWSLAEVWPGEQTIMLLVRKAAGLFIWAATACRFIEEGGELFGPDRLSDILEGDSSSTEPEDELNKIYIKVLENSISPRWREQEKERVYKILKESLGAIISLFSPLPASSLARLLHVPEAKFGAMLGHLHSILDLPKIPRRPVRLHHPSLRDFLFHPHRCRDPHFQVDQKTAHDALANHCIQLMSKKLKRDICNLHAPGAQATEISLDRVEHCLPAELQYACEYWVRHVVQSEAQLVDDHQVHQFLRNHLLYWLEALSLMEKTSEGVIAITSLESYISVS